MSFLFWSIVAIVAAGLVGVGFACCKLASDQDDAMIGDDQYRNFDDE